MRWSSPIHVDFGLHLYRAAKQFSSSSSVSYIVLDLPWYLPKP